MLRYECTEAIRERCHAAEVTVAALWRGCPNVRRQFPRIRDVWVK